MGWKVTYTCTIYIVFFSLSFLIHVHMYIRCLTVDWCLLQLKHRYDIEIDQAKRCMSLSFNCTLFTSSSHTLRHCRSIIHKICEGDDMPTRHMILCVCHMTQETNPSNEVLVHVLNTFIIFYLFYFRWFIL